MRKLLNFLQVKTIRSAKNFLIGAAVLFLYGVLQFFLYPELIPRIQESVFEIIFFSFWFLITSVYIALACWALFTVNGKEFINSQEISNAKINRNIFWYFKFLFATYAASLGTMILLGVISLPFAGYSGFDGMLASPKNGLYTLVCGLVWTPLIFKNLK